jgi:hypothetical protein
MSDGAILVFVGICLALLSAAGFLPASDAAKQYERDSWRPSVKMPTVDRVFNQRMSLVGRLRWLLLIGGALLVVAGVAVIIVG